MALYLILNESGNLENRWSVNPDIDFVPGTVFGKALKDSEGKIESTEWIDLVAGNPQINPGKKTSELAQRDQDRQDEVSKRQEAIDRKARLQVHLAGIATANTITKLRNIIEDLLKEITGD